MRRQLNFMVVKQGGGNRVLIGDTPGELRGLMANLCATPSFDMMNDIVTVGRYDFGAVKKISRTHPEKRRINGEIKRAVKIYLACELAREKGPAARLNALGRIKLYFQGASHAKRMSVAYG